MIRSRRDGLIWVVSAGHGKWVGRSRSFKKKIVSFRATLNGAFPILSAPSSFPFLPRDVSHLLVLDVTVRSITNLYSRSP